MKSKIEEKIEKAREATNEMFAAFDELNERLSEKLQPKFKTGEWFIPHKPKENKTNVFWAKEMDEFDGVALQVSEPKFKNAEGIYSEVADWHFHPDWCEKTNAPKHKEPIIGEMCIFWDNDKCNAACKILDDDSGAFFIDNSETYWIHAIPFESPEQYKAFLKS